MGRLFSLVLNNQESMMLRKYLLFVGALFSSLHSQAAIVDFEDIPLSPASFYNGSFTETVFVSQGAQFNNLLTDYVTFTAWGGWSVSNTTDTTTAGFGNQYSAFPGGGSDGGSGVDAGGNYGVAYVDTFVPTIPTVTFGVGQYASSVRVTNTTYAALVMQDGDSLFGVPKFGGTSGDNPDFFMLTIEGFDSMDASTGTIDFYLADFRFSDNSQDYIINTWVEVDLASLGTNAQKLVFSITSSDPLTPAYFAMDNLIVVPEPTTVMLFVIGLGSLFFGAFPKCKP